MGAISGSSIGSGAAQRRRRRGRCKRRRTFAVERSFRGAIVMTMLLLALKGMAIGLAIAMPIGPIALLVIRRSLARGLAIGAAAGLGAALADAIYGAISVVGFAAA